MKNLLLLAIVFVAVAVAQFQKPAVTVRELPPEEFPKATCTEGQSGYLGVTKDGKENTRLTDGQIGEYVRVRLAQGYSVQLWPQVSGKTFAIATCLAK